MLESGDSIVPRLAQDKTERRHKTKNKFVKLKDILRTNCQMAKEGTI